MRRREALAHSTSYRTFHQPLHGPGRGGGGSFWRRRLGRRVVARRGGIFAVRHALRHLDAAHGRLLAALGNVVADRVLHGCTAFLEDRLTAHRKPPNAPEAGGCPRGGTESPDRLVLGALDCRTARTASVQRDSLHGVECAQAGQRHGAACSRSGHTPAGNGFSGSQRETLQSGARSVNEVLLDRVPQTTPRTSNMTSNSVQSAT